MSLPVPILDDLTWAELAEDARLGIPATADRWTDHNAHDPGITILELMAWACEQTGYRIDQIPATHRAGSIGPARLLPLTSGGDERDDRYMEEVILTPSAEFSGVDRCRR